MNQKVNPAVSIVVILFTIGFAGFLLWYNNRERPRPTHYGLPPFLQKMENNRAASFARKPEDEAKRKKVAAQKSKEPARPLTRKEAMAAEMGKSEDGN